MQQQPMPPNFSKQFSIRSRKEPNAKETINIRHVEQWQTDPPYSDRASVYDDTAGIASRLHRESLDRNPPFQLPGQGGSDLSSKIHRESLQLLAKIQALDSQLRIVQDAQEISRVSMELQQAKKGYEVLLKAEKQASIESIGSNPYFDKYDVSSDSRNIIRELRGVVHEDVEDRGINESKKLLGRTFETRWLPQDTIEAKGMNSLEAYELMRPSLNKMSVIYRR
jgi:hypothetical protein